jgi:hypothetical protein
MRVVITARLARAGAGQDQQRPFGVEDRFALRLDSSEDRDRFMGKTEQNIAPAIRVSRRWVARSSRKALGTSRPSSEHSRTEQTQRLTSASHLIHEVTSPQAFDELDRRGWPVAAPDRTFCDARPHRAHGHPAPAGSPTRWLKR